MNTFQNIDALKAKKPQRLPTVLTYDETINLIDSRIGVSQLIVKILYGAGLRGIECVRLRVKDIDFDVFRHSFATHLLENSYDIRIIQELLGAQRC